MRRFIRPLLIFLLLFIFFLLSTKPIVEGDIFWHVKSGEWIWQHRSLMSEDPFTYTSRIIDPAGPDSVRYEVILKGYWLSQIIFYLIWSVFGETGIIVMRAFLVVAVLSVLFLWMRKKGVDFYLSIIFLCLSGYYMKEITDRPQNFSFLFFPVVAMTLEYLKPGSNPDYPDRSDGRKLPSADYLSNAIGLPLLMLIWSNMHGGYVAGVALIGIYMIFESLSVLYRGLRGSPLHRDYVKFMMICSISIIITLVNPTTYKTFVLVFHQFRSGPRTVSEMMNPFEVVRLYGEYKPTFWISAALAIVIMILRIKSVFSSRFMALLFFGAASFLMQRNITFFLCLTPLIAIEYNSLINKKIKTVVTAAALLFSLTIGIIFLLESGKGRIMRFEVGRGLYPEGAVRFMKIAKPSGNIFNLAEWGSYMILALPEYKMFDDGRRLIDDIEIAHVNVLFASAYKNMKGVPGWKAILNAFQVNTIIVPPVSPFLGDYFPIVTALYLDDDFSLVYQDGISLIYLRKGSGNDKIIGQYSAPKERSLVQAINILTFRPRSAAQMQSNRKIISELKALVENKR